MREYKNSYTVEVKLGNELIGLIGNILVVNSVDAITYATKYVEDYWQGERVHPTELHALSYKVKSIS